MKGVIVICLQDLVCSKFGKDKWEKALLDAGVTKKPTFLASTDVDDALVMKVVGSVCKVLGITLQQAADAFGDHWVNVYSQDLYKSFYERNTTAKALLLDMDRVHVAMTKAMPNARPPRFEYEWPEPNKLVMHYKSSRGLVDFLVGLARGVGKYYNETLLVTKLGPNKVQIVFPSA